MAIQQTVTYTKSDGTFTELEDARLNILDAVSDASQMTALSDANIAGHFTVALNFDADTQVLTFVRTWDEDQYTSYTTATSSAATANKASIESAGWTVSESVTTV